MQGNLFYWQSPGRDRSVKTFSQQATVNAWVRWGDICELCTQKSPAQCQQPSSWVVAQKAYMELKQLKKQWLIGLAGLMTKTLTPGLINVTHVNKTTLYFHSDFQFQNTSRV